MPPSWVRFGKLGTGDLSGCDDLTVALHDPIPIPQSRDCRRFLEGRIFWPRLSDTTMDNMLGDTRLFGQPGLSGAATGQGSRRSVSKAGVTRSYRSEFDLADDESDVLFSTAPREVPSFMNRIHPAGLRAKS